MLTLHHWCSWHLAVHSHSFGRVSAGSHAKVSHFLLRWEEEEVNRRLDRCMTESYAAIWKIHKERKLPLRTAAFYLALQRVTRAHIHRGFD